MSSLIVNCVFDELKDENQRLENELIFVNKCLKVLFEFKTNFFEILNFKTSNSRTFLNSETICLTSEDIQFFKDIDEEYNRVLTQKHVISEPNEELIEIQNKPKIDNNIQSNKESNRQHFRRSSPTGDTNNKTSEITHKRKKSIKNISPIISQIEKLSQKPNQLNDNNFETLVNKGENDTSIDILNIKSCDNLKINSNQQNVCNLKLIPNKWHQNRNEKKHKCPVIGCNFEYKLKEDFRSHQKGCHKAFKCQFCGKYFKNRLYFGYHKKYIQCKKTFKCDIIDCNFITSTKLALSLHNIQRHENQTQFICQINGCLAKFKTHPLLECHIKLHNDISPKFKCEFEGCDQIYRSVDTLNEHLKTHSNEELSNSDNKPIIKPNFMCVWPQCGQSFKFKQQLQFHYTRYKHEKPQSCGYEGCGSLYYKKEELKRHLKCHLTKKRVYSCDWPGCQYTTKKGLITHRLVHTNERKYLCVWPECGKAFKQKNHLDVHNRIHTNEKPYSCDWPGCEYRSSVYASLLSHNKIHNRK